MVAQLAKLAIQVAGGIVALGRLLLKQPFDDPSQRGGHGGRQGFGIFANNGRHGLGLGAAPKRPLPGSQFVKNEAERKLIGLRGEIRLSTRLLGAHVGNRANRSAGVGEGPFSRIDRARRVIGANLAVRRFGQAEIQNLDPAIARNQDIVGLQVAMDDAGGVSGGEAVAHLHRDIQEFARRCLPA